MGAFITKAEQAIARVDQLGDLAAKIFTEFDRDRILRDARRAQQEYDANPALPLAGMLVSVKDLYDEAGSVTSAGSRLLKTRPAASRDCSIIARIRAAGAICFGRTTMSEFAYSGVGINPHYGTPGNVFDPEGIPGGSSSGGGLTVAMGLADIALGTDTGGSVRIPAAINGLYGYKASRLSMPGDGIHPLAGSFDTAGPLARDYQTMLRAWAVMAGYDATDAINAESKMGGIDAVLAAIGERAGQLGWPGNLVIGVPENAFVDGLDGRVAQDFTDITARLVAAGHRLVGVDMGWLPPYGPVNKTIVASEAYETYGKDFDALETLGDPMVLSRMRFAETLNGAEKIAAYRARADAISHFGSAMAGIDVMIAPSIAIMAPKIAAVEADFLTLNALVLRNTSMLNLVDACAVSIPVASRHGVAPASLMIAAPHGHDRTVLAAGQMFDALLNAAG